MSAKQLYSELRLIDSIEWVLLECNESHLDFCWRSIKKVGGCTIKGCLGTNYGSEYTFESPTNAALSFEQLEAPIILNGTCCSLSVGEIDESSFQCSLSPLLTNSNAVYLPLQLYFQRRRTGEVSVFLCQTYPSKLRPCWKCFWVWNNTAALQEHFQFIKNTSKIYSCWLLCLNCERLDLKLKLKEPKEMWKTKDKVLDWFGWSCL